MNNAHYQVAAWSAFAAIVFVTVSSIEMRPGDLLSVDLDRALAFGLLASIFMIAYPRHAVVVGLLVVASAGAVELLQFLSPTRHARLDDALVKSGGALAGVAVALVYNSLRVARHSEKALPTLAKHHWTPPLAVPDESMVALSLTSKMIKGVYFSPLDGKLRVRMRNGQERLFGGVSEEDAQSLITAASPGRHYLVEIRTKYQRLAV